LFLLAVTGIAMFLQQGRCNAGEIIRHAGKYPACEKSGRGEQTDQALPGTEEPIAFFRGISRPGVTESGGQTGLFGFRGAHAPSRAVFGALAGDRRVTPRKPENITHAEWPVRFPQREGALRNTRGRVCSPSERPPLSVTPIKACPAIPDDSILRQIFQVGSLPIPVTNASASANMPWEPCTAL
jgi:hypothetical protein